MRVFNEEMYFHFIGEVFLYSFLVNFSSLSLTAHARLLADQSRNAGMLQLAET
jgi:hypothetical protein